MNLEDALRYNQDLTGRTFGYWTVLKKIGRYSGTRVLCRCVCGTEKEVLKANLLNGRSRSCGCMKSSLRNRDKNDALIGQQFGSWTVLDPKEKGVQLEPGCLYCRCVCGKERIVNKSNLLHGQSRSCGCRRKRNADGDNDEALVGKQFGSWTVLYPVRKPEKGRNAYLHCRCVCGTERDVLRYELLSGQSQSCGCRKSVNRNRKKLEESPEEEKERIRMLNELNLDPDSILGRNFGDWTVLRRDEQKPYRYLCHCVCGREKSVSMYLLLKGESKSCGCRGGVWQPRDQSQTDPVGKSFGFWTVLAPDENRRYYYRCRCVCGREKSVEIHALYRGETKSCGCMKGMALRILDEMDDTLPPEELREAVLKRLHEDPDGLVGKQFGYLTVLAPDENRKYYYRCRCVCGKEKSVKKHLLLNGESKSCGCRGKGRRKAE